MSWDEIPIFEFCKTGSGSTPNRSMASRYYGGSIPWVKSGELREKEIYETEEYVTAEALKESAIKLVPSGALLVAMYGATVGRMAVLKTEATTNQAVCHIVPDSKKADTNYLQYALRAKVPYLLSMRVGGGQPNISQQIIKETKIPLPPLPEQRRIAAILDKADAVRRKRQEAIRLTEEFLRSVFLDMFGDPVTNPKGWHEQRLDAVSDIQSGVTKGRKSNGQEMLRVPYMRVANVQDGHIDLSEIKEIEATSTEIERYLLAEGDILLTEGGDPDKLGRGAVWRGEIAPCIHQNHIFRVRPNIDILLPEYASAQIGSMRGKKYFLKSAKQTTGIASINKTQLNGFPTLIPPISLQNKFVEIVRKQEWLLEKLKRGASLKDDSFNSLVQRAFRGDL